MRPGVPPASILPTLPGSLWEFLRVASCRPYTDEKLREMGRQGVKELVVVPVSFVQVRREGVGQESFQLTEKLARVPTKLFVFIFPAIYSAVTIAEDCFPLELKHILIPHV